MNAPRDPDDYGPSWWIVPAIAGGAAVFTLIVLWLAGAL